MSTASSSHGAHILVCPFPAPGHIIPLLDLTRQLLSRGLTVTFLVTPANLPLLEPLLSTHPSSFHSLVLSYPVPPPDSVLRRFMSLLRGMGELRTPVIQWSKSHPSPPVAIISDFLLGWTHHLAAELGVPRVMFSPSSAFGVSLSDSQMRDPPKNGDPKDGNFLVSFPKIPNSPIFPYWQLSIELQGLNEDDPDWEFFSNSILDNMASWGLVFNTFTELERVYLDHFKKLAGHDRVWAVGPLLPPQDDLTGTSERGGSNSMPSHEVLTWLDQRQDDSVVYVCFGSRGVLTRQQMEVLAAALECSGVTFIWCVKGPKEGQVASDYGVIPDGFEDRVVGRGLVIKGWAPQVAILRHRAVGVFMTHCGWNSVLEGLSEGVMMLAWPRDADQFNNAMLLVDELKVGVRVGEGTQNIPDVSELTRLLVESVGESKPERARAKDLSGAAVAAVKGGSSERDLEELVKQLTELTKSGKV